jgi:hypothetical protein
MSIREAAWYLGTNESSLKAWLTPNATKVLDATADFYIVSIKGTHYVHLIDTPRLSDGNVEAYRAEVQDEVQRLYAAFDRALSLVEITSEMVECFRQSGAKQASDFIEQTDLPLPYTLAYAIKQEVHASKKRPVSTIPDTEEAEAEDAEVKVVKSPKVPRAASVAPATEPPALPPLADKPEELVAPLATVFDQGFEMFFQVVEMALVRAILHFTEEDQKGELERVLTRLRAMPETLTEHLNKCNDLDKKISELQMQLQILETTRAILKK